MKRWLTILILFFALCLRAEFKIFVDAGIICNSSSSIVKQSAAALVVDLNDSDFENFKLVSGTQLEVGKVFDGFLVLAVSQVKDGKCSLNADIELDGNEFLQGSEQFAILVLDSELSTQNKVKFGSKYFIFKDNWLINSENRGIDFYKVISVLAGGEIENEKLSTTINVEPSEEDLSDIKIDVQPQNIATYENKTVEFSASAYDVNSKKLIYTWQVDKGKGWVNAGSSKNTLKVSAKLKSDGFKYRLKIQNQRNGTPIYTDEVSLTVYQNAKITQKPKALTVFENGENSGFVVGAEGYEVKYQWQEYVKIPNEKGKLVWTWRNIDGATSQVFVPQNINALSDSKKYRCVVYNDGKTLYTSGVNFTVRQAAKIESLKIYQNKEEVQKLYDEYDITLTANAVGYRIKYQWQLLDENGVWCDVKRATRSTLKLSKITVSGYDGKTYRCKVFNDGSTDISNEITLNVFKCLAPNTLKGRKLELVLADKTYSIQMTSANVGKLFDDENVEIAKANLAYKRTSPTKASMSISFKYKGEDGVLKKVVLSDKKFDFNIGELSNAKVKLLPDDIL